MKTRFFLLILLVVGTVACHRNRCNFMAFHPKMCEAAAVAINNLDSISNIEHTDSMYLTVFFQGIHGQTCAALPNFSLGGEIMAFIGGSSPFEKPLESLKITSNQAFNEIPAGQDLGVKLWGMAYMGGTKIDFDEYLQKFKEKEFMKRWANTNFTFQFKEKPEILSQTLNIEVVFDGGQRFEVKGVIAEWK